MDLLCYVNQQKHAIQKQESVRDTMMIIQAYPGRGALIWKSIWWILVDHVHDYAINEIIKELIAF